MDLINQVHFHHRIVFVESDSSCSDDIAAANIYGYSSNSAKGIVFYGDDYSPLPVNGNFNNQVGVPVVYVTHATYQSIWGLTQYNDPVEITLDMEGDIDYHTSTKQPEPETEISDHKNFWWWVSATTLQDWLFLLFGFLCVILLLLIGLKFYRICKMRVNNSVVVRNLRVARIERIPTVQYNKSITNESCVICLEEFNRDSAVKVLACNHGYHPHCIDVWLMQSDKCPLCNADAIRTKKRCWDSCCFCCYPNRDDFGFQRMSDEEPEIDMEVEMNIANVEPIEVVDTYQMLQDGRGGLSIQAQ